MRKLWFSSAIGGLLLREEDGALTALEFREDDGSRDETTVLTLARAQLTSYFQGKRTAFSLPLRMRGTPFQERVWEEVRRLPYGAVASYGEIASRIGKPGAARAVGMANHVNPLPIVVPCHRVIGANGALTGYGGGLERKEMLLKLEREGIAL